MPSLNTGGSFAVSEKQRGTCEGIQHTRYAAGTLGKARDGIVGQDISRQPCLGEAPGKEGTNFVFWKRSQAHPTMSWTIVRLVSATLPLA